MMPDDERTMFWSFVVLVGEDICFHYDEYIIAVAFSAALHPLKGY